MFPDRSGPQPRCRQTHVGDRLTELGVRCGHVVANRRIHSEAVVCAVFNLTGGPIHHRLVDAAVTKGQLRCRGPGRGRAAGYRSRCRRTGCPLRHALQQLNLLVSGCRVIGAVGGRTRRRGGGSRCPQRVAFAGSTCTRTPRSAKRCGSSTNAQVQGDDGRDRGCEPAIELVRLKVGGVNRNGSQRAYGQPSASEAHLLQQFSFGAFCVLTENRHASNRSNAGRRSQGARCQCPQHRRCPAR